MQASVLGAAAPPQALSICETHGLHVFLEGKQSALSARNPEVYSKFY